MTAFASAVAAFVTPVLAVERTAAPAVCTSDGSLDAVPDVPFKPSQNFAHADPRFVLTVEAALLVPVPPTMDCQIPSMVVCKFVVAVPAVVFAVFAVPCAVAAFVTPVFAVERTALAAVCTSLGSFPVEPVVPFSPSQKFDHAVCKFVTTEASGLPVWLPPKMDCQIPSTVDCTPACAVAAFVTPVFAVDRTPAPATRTSDGSLAVDPVLPVSPSQNSAQPFCKLVITDANVLFVDVPPNTER